MTFTIHVPVFPMRKEIAARRQQRGLAAIGLSIPGPGRPPRTRARDADGYIELEMLPLDELEGVRRPAARKPKGKIG